VLFLNSKIACFEVLNSYISFKTHFFVTVKKNAACLSINALQTPTSIFSSLTTMMLIMWLNYLIVSCALKMSSCLASHLKKKYASHSDLFCLCLLFLKILDQVVIICCPWWLRLRYTFSCPLTSTFFCAWNIPWHCNFSSKVFWVQACVTIKDVCKGCAHLLVIHFWPVFCWHPIIELVWHTAGCLNSAST